MAGEPERHLQMVRAARGTGDIAMTSRAESGAAVLRPATKPSAPAASRASSYQRAAIDRFVASLPATAPLRPITASAAVADALVRYEIADARAEAAQSRYRGWAQNGLRATTFGVIVGALLLLPLDKAVEGLPRLIIGGLQTLALIVTFGATLVVSWWRPLDEWLEHRAEAEALRGELFKTIIDAAPQGGEFDAAVLASEKLDLVMAAHVDDQLAFFDRRAAQHARNASHISPIRVLGYALVAAAALLGIAATLDRLGLALPAPVDGLAHWLVLADANRWQLGIATIASGILSFASARSLMNEDGRKAKLYKATAMKLRRLVAKRLPPARDAAARGETLAVRNFLLEARAILDQEHAVWSFVREDDDIA